MNDLSNIIYIKNIEADFFHVKEIVRKICSIDPISYIVTILEYNYLRNVAH